jgi:hypothetical protein
VFLFSLERFLIIIESILGKNSENNTSSENVLFILKKINALKLSPYTGESRYLEVHGAVATFQVIRNLT